jgi:hypothetical protein
MLPVGMFLGWLGYGVASWGYLLVKGENITLREWFSPLHPYQGALGANGKVPKGSIFPTSGKGTSGTSGGTSPVQKQQKQNLKTKPNPHGFVQ